MNSIIEDMDFTKLTKIELLSKCQESGMKKYKSKSKYLNPLHLQA